MKNGFVSPECIEGTSRDAGDRARADRTDVQRRLSENRGGRFNEKNMEYEENSYFGSSSMFGWSNDRSGGRAGKTAISSSSHAEDFTEYSQLAERKSSWGLKQRRQRHFQTDTALHMVLLFTAGERMSREMW